MRSSTNRLQTPASITAWILSFGPSDRYESAQHASAKTSESAWNSRRESTGRHGDTLENSGGGFFPRHRFDRAHTAFRVIERRVALLRSLKIIHMNGFFRQNNLTIQVSYLQMHRNESSYLQIQLLKTIQNTSAYILHLFNDSHVLVTLHKMKYDMMIINNKFKMTWR
jgi:hypothetical protein